MTDDTVRLHRRMRHRWRVRLVVVIAAVAALFALGGWWSYALTHKATMEGERADTAVSSAEQLCEQVQQLGGRCVVDPASLRGETGPKGDKGEPGEDAPPPSDAQVRAAVEAYFAKHPPTPGRPPTPAEIAVAVINYLTEHPPAAGPKGEPGEDGDDVTPEMVAAAVRDYLTANPPPAGPAGPAGADGKDATPEMVAEQVRAYIAENPLPLCPDGTRAETRTLLTVESGTVEAVICVKVQTARR